jgi:hypothetical protein
MTENKRAARSEGQGALQNLADEINQCLQIILTNAGNIKSRYLQGALVPGDNKALTCKEAIAIEKAVERAKKATWAALAQPPASTAPGQSSDMDVMGCIACQGTVKDWCPIHGNGLAVPQPVAGEPGLRDTKPRELNMRKHNDGRYGLYLGEYLLWSAASEVEIDLPYRMLLPHVKFNTVGTASAAQLVRDWEDLFSQETTDLPLECRQDLVRRIAAAPRPREQELREATAPREPMDTAPRDAEVNWQYLSCGRVAGPPVDTASAAREEVIKAALSWSELAIKKNWLGHVRAQLLADRCERLRAAGPAVAPAKEKT